MFLQRLFFSVWKIQVQIQIQTHLWQKYFYIWIWICLKNSDSDSDSDTFMTEILLHLNLNLSEKFRFRFRFRMIQTHLWKKYFYIWICISMHFQAILSRKRFAFNLLTSQWTVTPARKTVKNSRSSEGAESSNRDEVAPWGATCPSMSCLFGTWTMQNLAGRWMRLSRKGKFGHFLVLAGCVVGGFEGYTVAEKQQLVL